MRTRFLAHSGAAQVLAGPGGRALATDGGTSSYFDIGKVPKALVGTTWIVQFSTFGTSGPDYASSTVNTGSSYIEDILLNSTGEASSSGALEFLIRDDTGLIKRCATVASNINDGRVHTVVWTLTGTASGSVGVSCWLDGFEKTLIFDRTDALSGLASNDTEFPVWLFTRNLRGTGSGGSDATQRIYLYARLPDAPLASGESLSSDPWQIFEAIEQPFYTTAASTGSAWSAAGTGAASWTGASNNSQPWTAAGTGVAAWTGGPLNSQPWTAAGIGDAAWVGSSVSSGSADWAAAGVGAAAWTGAATADSVWASAALGDANWAGAGGAVTATTPAAGGGGARRRRRPEIHYVVIDGVDHRVSSVEEAKEILLKLREVAAKRVQRQARKAVAKAPEAPVIQPIRATVKIEDYGTVFAQQLQAQVDAANAQIAEQYAQAVASAQAWQMHQRSLDDEDEEIETLILLGML